MVGLEGTRDATRSAGGRLSATLGLFGFNDTAGTLLAFRGWALHDQKTGAFSREALPPLGPDMAGAQPPWTTPTLEVDHRIGFYGRLAYAVRRAGHARSLLLRQSRRSDGLHRRSAMGLAHALPQRRRADRLRRQHPPARPGADRLDPDGPGGGRAGRDLGRHPLPRRLPAADPRDRPGRAVRPRSTCSRPASAANMSMPRTASMAGR